MTTTQTTRPLDPAKLMAFVFRAVDEIRATLNCALVVMGDRLGYYQALAHGARPPGGMTDVTVRPARKPRFLRQTHRITCEMSGVRCIGLRKRGCAQGRCALERAGRGQRTGTPWRIRP